MTKKCGNCFWFMMQPGHGECGACGNPLCNEEHNLEAYANGFYEYTTIDGDCDGKFWKPINNYKKYFGTPEKAANSITNVLEAGEDRRINCKCNKCLFREVNKRFHYCRGIALTTWLQERAG